MHFHTSFTSILAVPPNSLRVFLSKVKVLWRQWDVPTMVLASFFIQLVLIILGPLRKHTRSRVIIVSIWLAYLLADWVAAQAIGLISRPYGPSVTPEDQAAAELYAFWAQFLLLHMGGPDTITALALEDNELWLRTGLHLGVQVYGSLGVLVRSVAQSQSSLWVPTLMMFVAGIIKYLERVSSLFHGRLSNHEGVSIQRIKDLEPDDYRPFTDRKVLTEVETVKCAYLFFHRFTGWQRVEDPMSGQHLFTKLYMGKRTAEEAFRLMEIQLNIAYEVFYTKGVVIYSSIAWKFLRLVVMSLQVGCLVMWLLFTDDKLKRQQGFRGGYNIQITNTLLVGAIVTDVFAFLKIQLWTDSTISHVPKGSRIRCWFYNLVLSLRRRTWGAYSRQEDAPMWACFRRGFYRRWSDSVLQCSLVDICMNHSKLEKLMMFFGVWPEVSRSSKYVTEKWFSNHLRDFLFEDLNQKGTTKGGLENICKVKGGWACYCLMSTHQTDPITLSHVCELFSMSGSYDTILLTWHVITELCYYDDEPHVSYDGEVSRIERLMNKAKGHKRNATAEKSIKTSSEEGQAIRMEQHNYRDICKTLSDYLMYLVIHQQEMMPIADSATEQRFKALYTSLHFSLGQLERETTTEMASLNRKMARHRMACELIRKSNVVLQTEDVMNELAELEARKIGKWEFMAKVWAELLYYAAFRCKPSVHASSLKQGGELLTFVWLLLLQLGFGQNGGENSQFRLNKQKAEEKPERDLLYAYNKDAWEYQRPVMKGSHDGEDESDLEDPYDGSTVYKGVGLWI